MADKKKDGGCKCGKGKDCCKGKDKKDGKSCDKKGCKKEKK